MSFRVFDTPMKGNVLLVTSSANDLVGVVGQATKKTGRDLRTADTCRQTFEILSSGVNGIDLAIVDIAATLHSLAIVEALKDSEAAPPVIALVEADEVETTPIVQRHGAAACLRKPFGADELATLMYKVCASARRNRAVTCDKWGHVLTRGMSSARRGLVSVFNN